MSCSSTRKTEAPNSKHQITNKFQIPNSNHVTLNVYDLLGREVAVLVNERKAAGIFEISFDAASLSSGVYFSLLTDGRSVCMTKMLLIH